MSYLFIYFFNNLLTFFFCFAKEGGREGESHDDIFGIKLDRNDEKLQGPFHFKCLNSLNHIIFSFIQWL